MNAAVLMLEPETAVWRDVAALTDVPLRGARRVRTAAGDVAIFRTGAGEVFALLDRCPHKHGPLSQGIVHGAAVTCPLHAWVIDLASGQPQGADAGKGCVPVVGVKVEGERIFLADPGEGGLA